ncbi:MAG: hypothetical protein MUE81_14660 [Thermoflexibacter sp.]|jgi:hypothetical protein|nr:hypothetical protein [Thermoflexibacter sp.]
MDIFPEQYELIWLFESEPQLSDNDDSISIYYKPFTYQLTRNNFSICCTFLLSYGDLDLLISHEGNTIVDLHLTSAIAIRVRKDNGKELLEVDFRHETTMKTLYLYLKPHIYVSWCMEY